VKLRSVELFVPLTGVHSYSSFFLKNAIIQLNRLELSDKLIPCAHLAHPKYDNQLERLEK
jgi:hypothetical protein